MHHFISILSLFFIFFSISAQAEDGIFPDKIVFGQTAAIGGPAAELGLGMQLGILAAFKEKNDAGGINGRRLELITLDDGYEPDRAVENTKKLINAKKVFALIGGVGTPTSGAIEPIITKNKIPYIGPFTGAEFLRKPYKRYIINIRGSYYQETEIMAKYLVDNLGLSKISILYQDDSFGTAGESGLEMALKKRNLNFHGEARYKRNTEAVKRAVLELSNNTPEAIVMIGTYKPLAKFVKLYQDFKGNPKFIALSFVGTEAFAQKLGAAGKDIVITQVVPSPFNTKLEIVKKYKNAIFNYAPEAKLGHVSLEGYIVGLVAITLLENTNDELTRENFIDAVSKVGTFNFEELNLNYGTEDNQGMDTIYGTKLTGDRKFETFNNFIE